MNWAARRIAANIDRSEQEKDVVRYRAQSNSGPSYFKAGSRSQVWCCACREKRHTSYACPQQRVNLVELEEEEEMISEPTYDNYDDEQKEVDLNPVEGESLLVRQVMITLKVEEEDWKWHNIFWTWVLYGRKLCDVVVKWR